MNISIGLNLLITELENCSLGGNFGVSRHAEICQFNCFPLEINFKKKHLTCCTFAQEVGSGKPSNLTLQSDCVGQFKTTKGKMKSDTDSQERQRTIISRSTVECMLPSLPPPPPHQKKNNYGVLFLRQKLTCFVGHAMLK